MTFKRSFGIGKQGEDLVLKIFKKNNIELEVNKDNTKLSNYDLVGKIGQKKFTIEIKFDYMAEKSGNLCLEYYNPIQKKDSGIAITKAKIWCQIILDLGNPTIWLSSVKKLKNYIKENKPFKDLKGVGDGNANIYLYRVDKILKDIFHRIDDVNQEQFKKIIKELL